jgi:DNA repair protein RecO
MAYSETSFIGVFYTEYLGLQRFIFKGGQKRSSGYFPFMLYELTFYKRPESDLASITEILPLQINKQLNNHPIYCTVAFFFADIIRNVLRAEQKDQAMFDFLVNMIQLLDTAEQDQLSELTLRVLIKLCEKTGILPQCEAKVKLHFIPEEGLFTDLIYAEKRTFSGEGVLLIQAILMDQKTDGFGNLSKREALNILMVYFEYHIPSFNVKRTLEVIREILYT